MLDCIRCKIIIIIKEYKFVNMCEQILNDLILIYVSVVISIIIQVIFTLTLRGKFLWYMIVFL